jgi:hypothetical protein
VPKIKIKACPKLHPFTEEGRDAFHAAVEHSIFDLAIYHDITITIGNHQIQIPMLPEMYALLEDFTKEALTEYIAEYGEYFNEIDQAPINK